jgi:hypothetical protein
MVPPAPLLYALGLGRTLYKVPDKLLMQHEIHIQSDLCINSICVRLHGYSDDVSVGRVSTFQPLLQKLERLEFSFIPMVNGLSNGRKGNGLWRNSRLFRALGRR